MFQRALRARILAELLFVAGCQPERHLPSCPSGKWCTTIENVASIAEDAGPPNQCPSSIHWEDSNLDGGPTDLPSRYGYGSLDNAMTSAERAKGKANACCYQWGEPCPGGRALVDRGRTVVANLGAGAGWCGAIDFDVDDLSSDVRRSLADAWRADAFAEHASVASFARAAIELMQVGAPADLVRATQAAGLDEIEHARMCFAIASVLAGERLAPGSLPTFEMRAPSLVRLAVDTFLEGCVGETIAAAAASRAAAQCSTPAIRDVLARIAEEEADHAALAWRTVAWAVREGGDAVRDALRSCARERHVRIQEDDPILSRFGRLSSDEQAAVEEDSWRDIIEPALRALLVERAFGVIPSRA